MSIRKRIAALGAAAVMATSMSAIGASADFTMTYTPNGKLQGCGEPINSKPYSYKLAYKKADINSRVIVTLPKKVGSGYVGAYLDYYHDGKRKTSDNYWEKKFINSDSGTVFIVSAEPNRNKPVKNNAEAFAKFRVKSNKNKVKSKTFKGYTNVTYHN